MVVLCSIVMSISTFHAANRVSISGRRAPKFSFQLTSITFKNQRNFSCSCNCDLPSYSGKYTRLSCGRAGFASRKGARNSFISAILKYPLMLTKNFSNPCKCILHSIVMSIPAFHAQDRGSHPWPEAINEFF